MARDSGWGPSPKAWLEIVSGWWRTATGTLAALPAVRRMRRWIAPAGQERGFGLPARLLGLTVLFVMLAEIVIFVPSIANYRLTWLNERLAFARLAALASDAVQGGEVPAALRRELLMTAQVRMVSVKSQNRRQLLILEDMDTEVAAEFDLQAGSRAGNPLSGFLHRLALIRDALAVFATGKERLIRVMGQPAGAAPGETVDIIMMQEPLHRAMVRYGTNILALSVLISIFTGWLVYVSINASFIRPIMRLSANMETFSAKPEDTSRIIVPSARADEIGTAERQLASMQTELTSLLAQKTRLAALGLAVSKISHDLRNLLATAQLVTDNLASVSDPRVQRFAPKLVASLDRAINLCNDTLRFGRAAEQPPRRELFDLRPVVEDVGEGLMLPRKGTVDYRIAIVGSVIIDADRDQLYRVLSNLVRNAAQVIEQSGTPGGVEVRAARNDTTTVIDVIDDGPGLPPKAREHLFQAFQGSSRRGGTGLGLAIAHELIAAHGGSIRLVDGAERGAHFRIEIPDRRIEV